MTFLIRLFIRFYQLAISPLIHWVGGPGAGCRYTPSCSEYFLEAVEKHGPLSGSIIGFRRILRCAPWGGHGHDPVPCTKKETAGTEFQKISQDG